MDVQTIRRWRRRLLAAGIVFLSGALGTGLLVGQEMSVMVGVKAGTITTGVASEVDSFLNTDWRSGLSAGGFVSVDPRPNLVLRADFLLSQRGFGFRRYEDEAGLIPGEVRVRSFEIQVDLGFRLPWEGESASVRLFAGPALGFELSCEVQGSAQGMAFDEKCDEPGLGLETETVDYGFSFGGGVDLYFLPVTVVMDGRYTRGLRNLLRGAAGTESLRSRAWNFTVGLGWPL
jgi:hypothetical protein